MMLSTGVLLSQYVRGGGARVAQQTQQRAPEDAAGAAQPRLDAALGAHQPRPLHHLADALHRRQLCRHTTHAHSYLHFISYHQWYYYFFLLSQVSC